jgi:small subunit ribosomal protein S20
MPLRHKSAQKRARQTTKRTERNKLYKAQIRTALKKVMTAKDKESAEKELKTAVSTLDRISTKGVIHKNNAARKKSKLVKHVNKIGQTTKAEK